MLLSISTATFYDRPFQEALCIIKNAGFENIELVIPWEGGDGWKMAQHLKEIVPRDAIKMIDDSGLRLASIHDASGVISDNSNSAIDKLIFKYIDNLSYPLDFLVVHPPHIKSDSGNEWWDSYKNSFSQDINSLKQYCKHVCVENLPKWNNYYVALTEVKELFEFSLENDVFINFDTTHYAQSKVDIFAAFNTLNKRIKSIHLSDYLGDKAHVFIGDGSLDLKNFIKNINNSGVQLLTLECEIEVDNIIFPEKLIYAKEYVEDVLNI